VIDMAASVKSGGGILSTMVDKRGRRTKAAMADIRAVIKDVLRDDHPMTVRQVFYQLVVRETIEKSELVYKNTVVRLLSEMRLEGKIPWSWITDESRRTRQTETFDSVRDALETTAKFYRRSGCARASSTSKFGRRRKRSQASSGTRPANTTCRLLSAKAYRH
jgi:hypothetical protein